jgi:hypothetical protein
MKRALIAIASVGILASTAWVMGASGQYGSPPPGYGPSPTYSPSQRYDRRAHPRSGISGVMATSVHAEQNGKPVVCFTDAVVGQEFVIENMEKLAMAPLGLSAVPSGAYFSPTNNLTSDRTAGSVIGKTCPRCLNCLQRQLLFPLNTSSQSCSIEDFLDNPSISRIYGSFSSEPMRAINGTFGAMFVNPLDR